MKNIIIFLLSLYSFSQSSNCVTVAPMCSGGGLTFQNTTNSPVNDLNVGCLDETPNQAWFYLQIGSSGTLNFQISQVSTNGTPIDVDFICWGPFPENSTLNLLCPLLYDYPNLNTAVPNNIIDCSYLPNAIENFTINNTIQGQIYFLLITNYDNLPGSITLSQTNLNQPNSGTTSCDAVCDVSLGGNRSLCNGQSITLTATLTSSNIQPGTSTYQWFKDGVLITGAISNTLIVSQSGQYQVVVTRVGCPTNPPPSDTVNVTFGGQAVINTNPLVLSCNNDQTFNLNNQSSTILNGNTGTLVFYNSLLDAQNQQNPIVNPTNFAGTHNQTICAKVNITGDTCPYYSCFTLSCLPPPCPVISNPQGVQSICLGFNPLPLSVNVTNNSNISFVYFTTPQTGDLMYFGGTLLQNVNSVNSVASFDPPILGSANSFPNAIGTYYVYAIINPTPQFTTCRPFQEIIINVVNPPTPAIISGNSIQCNGLTSQFTSNVAVGTWSSSNTSIITINSLTGLATGITNGTAKIRFTIPATATCNAVVSEFDVVVNLVPPPPTFPTQITTYCENSIVPALVVIGTQIKWYTSATGGIGQATMTPDTTITGTTLYYATQTINGCESPRAPISVTINPISVINFTNNAPVICSGQSTQITLNSPLNNVIYSWNGTSTPAAGALSGTGTQFINHVLTNTTQFPIVVTYTVFASANDCANVNSPKIISVIVNPNPTLTLNPSTDFSICSRDTANISFSGTIPLTLYNYTVINSFNVIGFTANGIGTSISDTLINNNLTDGFVTYQITPIFGICSGTSKQISVTVKPRPVAIPVNTTYAEICSGQAPLDVIFNSNHPNTAFEFTVEQFGVTGAFNGNTFNNINGSLFLDFQVLINESDVKGYVEYTIKPLRDGCYGTPVKVRIYVNPLPKPKLENGVICVNEQGIPLSNFVINSGFQAPNYSFQWIYKNNAGTITTLTDTTSSLSVNQVGSYQVIVTNTLTGCTSFPSNYAVISSTTQATSIRVESSQAFNDVPFIEITVLNGSGNYLYQLNDGAWQTSNIFQNVIFGNHIIRVKDTLGCTFLTENVKIINHPQYFTPNGDGYNDTWKIIGLENQLNSIISIFNKYGKLLKQISTSEFSNGWDGTYIGNPLPADDYWFTITYTENEIEKSFKSHFSLIR